MKNELTPWFPGQVKPKRVGLYQQHSGLERVIGYQYWDGSVWHSWAKHAQNASKNSPAAGFFQHDKWRGLAEKP